MKKYKAILIGMIFFITGVAYAVQQSYAENLSTELAAADVTLSTGNFNQAGECDGSNSWPCDMNMSSGRKGMSSAESSAIITLGNPGKLEIDFLKSDLKPALNTQFLKGNYILYLNFEISNEEVKQALGFFSNQVELLAGDYPVTEKADVFSVVFDYQTH